MPIFGIELGVAFAIVSMFAWGFGDFLIQKSTRKVGDWETLFLICFFGLIVLFPFVYSEIPAIFSSIDRVFLILILASLALFFASLLQFESLKKGKIAVIEPIFSIEVPIAALAAFFFLRESSSVFQIILITLLIIGLVLVSLRSYHFERKIWLEKAVVLAVFSAIAMGLANLLVGLGARETSALTIIWFTNLVIVIFTFIFLASKGRLRKLKSDLSSNKKVLLGMCILDNLAWVSFAAAMVLSPIAITVALSESYIIIAVLLGVFVNKEHIMTHQKIGLFIAIVSAVILAVSL